MRLHHLTVTAFGPFAGTERVDFDELNDAGLFLLTGPTGAGKTSILDAVCFALYGSVPGVRGVKALKSQHADVDTAPEVVLDFSVRDRRFVVRRSPEWLRPKRKGSGLVAEKASATLVEITSGEDHFLSSRAQEVGHLVGDLMGMTASQFVQVAMLPQGEFQRFLRAGSDERHAVLQHLFKTDRFSRIEEWVTDHSRGLRDQAARGQSSVQRILDTMADRAAVPLPEDLCEERLPSAAADGRAPAWADEVVAAAEARLVAATARHDQTASALTAARTAHDDGQRTAGVLARRDRALATLAGLAADQDAETAARAALQGDGRAAPCLPVLRLLDAASAQQTQAAAGHADALAAAVAELGSEDLALASPGRLDELHQQLRAQAARAEALLPRERERRDADAALRAAEVAAATARADQGRVEQRRATLPDELAALRERLAAAAATAGRREALLLALESAQTVHEAAEQVPTLEREVVRLQDLARDARDRLAEARERVQDLADRRLAGIAAELAGRLAEGHPCQVCGSVAHPAPAQPHADAVTESEQEQAAADLDARTEDYAQAARAVADAERTLTAQRQAAQGLDATAGAAKVAGVRDAVVEAERAADECAALEQQVIALGEEQDALADRATDLGSRLATVEQAIAHHRRTIAHIDAEIRDVTGEEGGTLADLVERSTQGCRLIAHLATAVQDLERARARVRELADEAARTATGQGFADVAAASAAVLPATERERLEELLAGRTRAAAEAQAVLADPEVSAVDGCVVPDLDRLRQVLQDADQDDAAAARELHQCDEQVTALRQARERLRAALEEWAPVRDRFTRADAMAKLVRGMGHDNQLQMRLSAYVLATRLDQVVAAANERLAHMRDQRYLLQRTGRAHRKGSQAGLGLEVVDQWTGDVRDPATLSGGETFVVSLSLALGLADVVTQEAGGTEIDTLFVDEGFGTLDPDTLDDVMDRLDGLRAGGRTVGVVSHVSELRNRIPMQLHVDKHRTGSTVAVRTLAG